MSSPPLSDWASDAAAIALHANKGPAAAVERLETGRGVIAGGLFEPYRRWCRRTAAPPPAAALSRPAGATPLPM